LNENTKGSLTSLLYAIFTLPPSAEKGRETTNRAEPTIVVAIPIGRAKAVSAIIAPALGSFSRAKAVDPNENRISIADKKRAIGFVRDLHMNASFI